jgi:pimeloyl-ACP methyl ester carboxylesterase
MLSDTSRTNFLELQPRSDASGTGVMVVPGAGWGASALRQPAALLTEAGHAVVLCDPSGTAANPGPFDYDGLLHDCAARAAGWSVGRVVVLAHSMGAHTAARLARLDPRIEQIWVAPVLDGRSTFAGLYAASQAGQFHHVLFEPPLSATERTALEVLSTDAWLHADRFDTLESVLALPSRGGVRVPHVWDFLREVAHPGYVLAPQDAVRLQGVLVPRDDAWVPLGASQTFCAAARVPLHILSRGRGHALSGGWSEVLETVRSWLDDGVACARGKTHGIA